MKILRLGAFLLFSISAHAIDAGRSLYIEGYPGETSYAPGDTAEFHISTTSPIYSVEIKRIGAETKTVHAKKKIEGGLEYSVTETASAQGCGWPVSYRVEIGDDWPSGYYEMVMRISDRGGKFSQRNTRTAESKCFFIVRPKNPGTKTKILLQLATNTYNAYNNWGGASLYGYHGRAKLQGHEVSFHRPQNTSFFGRWELDFVRWAETNGYALDYCSNMDLQTRPELVKNYSLVLSVGHDEYWSSEMRDTIEDFIADGGNVAFLSGNTCCWQVRWQVETQSLLCWKQWYNQDPFFTEDENKPRLATLWSHHLIGRTENEMTGVGFIHGGYHRSHGHFMDGSGAFKVHRPDHWILEGTELKQDEEFGGKDTIVGYECDGCEIEWRDGMPFPTHRDGTPKNFEILATCPAQWAVGDSAWYDKWPGKDHLGNAVFGTWKSEKGGTVITTGSTDWVHGLKGGDKNVIQITKNILDRLSK